MQNDILCAIDKGKCVLLILLDLSAAFDTVDHKSLLKVLAQRLGINGSALQWFENYLKDRIQAVVIDGIESEIWNILFGVPQGSVLGPILFIIYTSPLGDILRHHGISYHFYADDTQLYVSFDLESFDESISKLENCISDIRKWMATHFLCLNDSKTEMLLIGKKHMLNKLPDFSLRIGTENIKPIDSARNIGAIFDKTMTMKQHIASISKAAWFHLKRIGQIRPYIDDISAKTLMHSFVSSRLDNFNSLLCGVPDYELNKLQRIQNAAARIITGSRKFEHITPSLIKLHWLPIKFRIEYKILLLTYKALNGLAPQYLSDLLIERSYTR